MKVSLTSVKRFIEFSLSLAFIQGRRLHEYKNVRVYGLIQDNYGDGKVPCSTNVFVLLLMSMKPRDLASLIQRKANEKIEQVQVNLCATSHINKKCHNFFLLCILVALFMFSHNLRCCVCALLALVRIHRLTEPCGKAKTDLFNQSSAV